MKDILANLIKVWGLQKVMQGVISFLRKQGRDEQQLASDFEQALEAYNKRRGK